MTGPSFNIIIFTHPLFVSGQSMSRYARMLTEGMKERGHTVETWTASPFFYKLPAPKFSKKWLGYIDQFVVFPMQVKKRLKHYPGNTLFVFSDQALGPWVPLVAKRPHVIHCHDFLAQQSAQNMFPENQVSLTGKLYQLFIRKGFQKGKNFISISQKTKNDLETYLEAKPDESVVVYNGLNQYFSPGNPFEIRTSLSKTFHVDLSDGYILHVGNNSFYKNRRGVIDIYDAWRESGQLNLPLIMLGSTATAELQKRWQQSPYKNDICWVSDASDELLRMSYSGATLLLFPSLAEGFGWPIAEAMASGCLVVTTNEAPMTEVAGNAAFLIKKRPSTKEQAILWAKESAAILNQVIILSTDERQKRIEKGIENALRFNTKNTMAKIEVVYKKVLALNHIENAIL